MKRLHYLQHVKFENLNYIKTWAENNNFMISQTAIYDNNPFPDHDQYDWLIILGGPMNIYEYDKFPWLKAEKEFIEKAIHDNKKVIGICLGAQLIAHALGAKIYKNEFKEIGWFPVKRTDESAKSRIFSDLPVHFQAFHWHGDTFDIPYGSVRTVSSSACENQAFEYNNGRVIGLQFHLESTIDSVNLLVQNCADEISEGEFIQSEEKIISGNYNINDSNQTLIKLLNNLNRI